MLVGIALAHNRPTQRKPANKIEMTA